MLHWFSLRQRWIDTERFLSHTIFRYSKLRRWPLLNTGWWKLQPCHNLLMPCQKLIFHLTATSCWWLKIASKMLIFTMFIGQVLCQPSGNYKYQNWLSCSAQTAQDLAVGRLESPVGAADLAPPPLGAQEGPDRRAVHRRHRQRAALRHHTQPRGRHRPAPGIPGAVHNL